MINLSAMSLHFFSNIEPSSQEKTLSPAHQLSALEGVDFEALIKSVKEEIHQIKNNDPKSLLHKEEYIKAVSLKIWDKLESEKKDDENYNFKLETARYPDIPTEESTTVIASDGTKLPFNTISLGEDKVAILGQYPTVETLSSYSRMLVDNKPAVLVIISSEEDIVSEDLPEYFSSSHEYENSDNDYYVDFSVKKESLSGDMYPESSDFDFYESNIKISNGESADISILHFKGWGDYTSLEINKLDELVNIVTDIRDRNIEKNNKNGALIIHCLAGVDRSGVLLAAIAIHDDPTRQSNLKAIINNMRASRSPWMVSYEAQLRCLVEYCFDKGYPLDDSDDFKPRLRV